MKQLFTFNNKAETIYPFLKGVVAFIEKHSLEKEDEVSFKTRVIVTELLTNSIKHTAGSITGVELSINNNIFTIKKIDEGGPFHIKDPSVEWPLTDLVGTTLTIYADALNGLFAKVITPNSLSFYSETYPDEDIILSDISEHFGLVIICRACNSFVYQYNPSSKQSIFTVTINLT